MNKHLTIVIPVFNEEKNILPVFEALKNVMAGLPYAWDVLFVDDGSRDGSLGQLRLLSDAQQEAHYLELSRNFGKEAATTAGLAHAKGDGVILMDADLQHPPELIRDLAQHWEAGADVVVGIRVQNQGEGVVKRWGSKLFYRIMDAMSETELQSGETDFRLIDRRVVDQFNALTERNRMTRALLNWLGYRRVNVPFTANARTEGLAGYSHWKLVRLATQAFVANSLFPLKIAGYLGILITITSGALGAFMFFVKFVARDQWGFNFSGPAFLAVMILFLIGIVLVCLGLVALYIGSIHAEVANRPLFIVREKN